MGYALKVKGVDFADVAVDQVSYVNSVPCTDVTLDQDTLTFTQVGETATLTATLTPSDTTDTLVWSSSDENVATVSDGVVTIHGLGSVTITATCGESADTASISQATIKAAGTMTILTDKVVDGGQYVSGDYLFIPAAVSGQSGIVNTYTNQDKVRVISGQTNDCELILVPYGATKIKVATQNGNDITFNYMYIGDTENLVTYNGANYPPKTSQKTFVHSSTGADVEYGQAVAFRTLNTNLTDTPIYAYFE